MKATPKFIGLVLISVLAGWILFQSMGPDSSMKQTLVIMSVMMLPFMFVWRDHAREIFVAVLTLTLPFNIDQTLHLRAEHVGGAKGYIVSVNGIVIILLFILLFIEQNQDQKKKIRFFGTFSLPYLGIILMCFFSMAAARDHLFSLYETLEVIKMGAIFIYIANYIRQDKRLRFVLFFLFFGLMLESLIALAQKATGSSLNLTMLGGGAAASTQMIGMSSVYRPGGTLGGANALAWYLDYLLPFGAAFLFYPMKKILKNGLIILLCMGTLVLFITMSRGGWLGFLVGVFVVGLFHLQRLSIKYRIYLVLILTIGTLIGGLILTSFDNPVRTRFMSDDNQSAYIRIPLMKVAYSMIKASPLIGHGINNYVLVHRQYDNTPENVAVQFPYPVHNLYLQTAVEIGLPGLLLFGFFLGRIFYRLLKSVANVQGIDKQLYIGIIAGLSGALLHGLVENASFGSYHLLPIWFFSGLAVGRLHMHASGEPS